MGDNPARRAAARPRRVSAAAELGANVSPQDGEAMEVHPSRETQPGLGAAAAGRMDRRNSAPQPVHQRHMPIDPLKFHIPRKTKEKRALFHHVSSESREYEDMMTILTSSFIDTTSASCYTYCKPRLVQSELQEKEFVEKRKEMKVDGRTDKELEESYCFLLSDTVKTPSLCEKGLLVGHSRITVLGNPTKGVYLSRYSDLLQSNPLTPGFTGEIIIFKVMKGKIKSIYENMKNLLDPTPRFDSHISKNISKVTSVNSYRAFELTQHYFYEYSFDELRPRPRQVCPYAVLSFQFKGKDSALPTKPLAPLRSNSQSAEGVKERAQFTVWNGDLVQGDRVLYQISLRSFSPPVLPHKLPEKLEIGLLMRLDKLTKLLPSELFSYNLYTSSHKVVKSGHCCSLLEVTDRFRSTTSITKLLHELEKNRVVLVTPLTEKGFLFLMSSVQMATASEREESWKRCLQALFIFPESRELAKKTGMPFSSSHDASVPSMSGGQVMPRLSKFIPALHHALVKARANPPPELSAGVERQAREYLMGLKDGKVREYPMGEYEPTQDDRGAPPPKHHRVNMDGYLRSYLYSPALYLLSVARARQMVEMHCGPEDPREAKMRRGSGGQREAGWRDTTGNSVGGKNNTERMQQLIDLVMTCKRNAENEVKREEAGRVRAPGRKRKLEQETAERALKFLKASQEHGRPSKIAFEETPGPASHDNLLSVIGSVGLKDVDLREDGSELAAQLVGLLTGLSQAARGTNQSPGDKQEEGLGQSYPFDRLATKLGLPTNCDIDLRRQEELEEQTAGSVSSLEGFSPGSHSGEMNHRGGGGAAPGGLRGRGGYEEGEEEWEIPWILIPITGLSSERYTKRDRNLPQDPRFQHLTPQAGITNTTKPQRKGSTPSPEPSPPPSPFKSPSPEPSQPPSPSQCPSPDPSPPTSPSHCPSPEPSPPLSPSQCPSPEPSPPPSPSQCPSPQPSSLPSPSHLSPPPSPSRCRALGSTELSSFNQNQRGANEERLASTASRESAGVSKGWEKGPQGKKGRTESLSSSIHPSVLPTLEKWKNFSPHPAEGDKEDVNLSKEKETQRGGGGGAETVGEKQKEGDKPMQVEGLISSHPPPHPLHPIRGTDTIVDEHLRDFSSEIQHLLQGEGIHYSCQQSPHSSSNTDIAALPHLPQFSHYVSFCNSCPPMENYVSSLQDSMSSMLAEFGVSMPSKRPANSRTVDAALESTVSAFVSSIRANVQTDRDGGEESAAVDSGGEVWQPLQITKQFSDAANGNSPTFHVTLSDSTSVPGSGFKPSSTPVLPSPPPHALEITRTVMNNVRETQDSSTRTVQSTSSGENYKVTLPGFRTTETPQPSELAPDAASEPVSSTLVPSSGLAPPTTALNSLISQLQPEVFNSLVEIIKDVKRNSLQFYIHSTEPGDPVYEGIKDQLLQQGNVQQQSPVTFLAQGYPENRLLVIIKNKDISGRVHEIPGLVSLKRHPSVVFMGIDTPDDVMNNSFNELFVCGGCIVSDELILNPDYITHERLAALLQFLELRSSPESMWRWKIHCKTHKKLKEQARFRMDAATLLDMLSAYQKRQIIEFLPYHHCDMVNNQSPDLQCLLELQARYTQYRHTVFLTERHFEKLPAYSNVGIVVASIDDILHDFPRLIGEQDVREKLPPGDEIPKKLLHPVSSGNQSHHLLHQSGPGLSHLSDQLVPDASIKDGMQDYEILRHAISQLRAERQAQLQELQELERLQQQRLDSKTVQKAHQDPRLHIDTQVAPGKNAVAATLDLIHSALQTEEEEEEGARALKGVGVAPPRENQTPALMSNQSTATAQPLSHQTESANERRDAADQRGHRAGAVDCPAEGDRARKSPSDVEPTSKPADLTENLSASADSSTGSITPQTQQDNSPDPAAACAPPQHSHSLIGPPRGHMTAPLRSLGGIGSLLGPVPMWTRPTGAPALVWGLQQTGRDFPRPGLLGDFHNHVQPGGSWQRGGQRGGGGFNRM